MNDQAVDCIYPGPHTEMSEEHYLSAALGEFRGYEPLYGRVCRACNTKIGDTTEVQLLRTGPIAFFRWVVGTEGQDGPPPSPFYRGAGGAPPICIVGRPPGANHDLLWEVVPGTEDVYPLRQIVFEHPIAGRHPIALLDRMRDHPQLLLDELRDRGLETAKPAHVYAAPDEIPWVEELLKSVGGIPPGAWATTTFQPQRIQLVVNVRVTSAHFRAIAKIAFHYTLKMFPDLVGKEREFDASREFIWAGGDIDRFVRQRPPETVLENWRRGQRPSHWMHILVVERRYERINAYVQLFAGPRSLPPLYEVGLGIDPSRIARRREWRAHQFVILDPRPGRGPVGVMEDLQPANYIAPA